jgi:lysophospholipase L1-like esterase
MPHLLLSFLTLLLAAAPAVADDPAGERAWWNIPYPDRFDAATLVREQPAVTIAGADFVTAHGSSIVFRGVNVGDPAKLAAQERWKEGLFEEIHRWGANCVRLPIHPAPWREQGADWYFARIDEAVRWANARGMYLILDWHSIGNLDRALFQHPMYETTRVETMNFWRGIAHRYRGVATLALYELFNEPTDNYIGAGTGSLGKASWDEWRVTLEDLIDLVRVYDPEALPLVGGFNWAYDLGQVPDKPIRRERVAYAVHAYPQKARPEEPGSDAQFALWQQQWGHLADRYPLVASEIGWVRSDGYNPHVPVIDDSGSYGPMLVQFMEERGMSWTVWNFDPDWAPTMIADWDFTPTEQGRFFRYVMQELRDGAMPLSVLPAPRLTEYPWMSVDRWRVMHAEDVAIAERGGVDLLFLGDSITEGWPDFAWTEAFADAPANFGIGGDRTENLLWRLRNGAVGSLEPRVVVVMIGVNNFGFREDTAEEVFEGVAAVIDDTKAAFGNARIVLLGILPYGEGGPDTVDRQRVAETNRLLAGLAEEDPRVAFHDLGAAFLRPDGTIPPELMADHLHPTDRGYEVYAGQLQPILAPLFR